MAKGRPPICPVCTKNVSKEEGFEYKGKYYHVKCFNQFSKQETKEKTKQIKEKQKVEEVKKNIEKETLIQDYDISDEEILEKEKVIKYIKQLLDCNILNVKIYALLKNYCNSYKFTYSGILAALKYYYGILNNPVVSDVVGILPYIYEEAQEYEKTKRDIIDQTNDINFNEVVSNKTIRINKPQLKPNKNLIDISKLE